MITLSTLSNPLISLCAPGFSFDLYIFWAIDLYNTSLINEDFPLPETPVTTMNEPNGNFTFTFFKLLQDAPLTSKKLPFPFLLV